MTTNWVLVWSDGTTTTSQTDTKQDAMLRMRERVARQRVENERMPEHTRSLEFAGMANRETGFEPVPLGRLI